jgi:hypothetical protein
MKTRNVLCSLTGIWFIVAPWVLGLSLTASMIWTSTIFGAIQLVSSALALKKSNWTVLQNWLTLLTGIWFAVFSINFSLSFSQTWTIGMLGIVTIIMTLWTMDQTM